MTFVIFGLGCVPVAVFTISAFFAIILWALECGEVETPAEKECDWHSPDCICSYYQWWIYIIGNLVGVGLTNVAPAAGHVFAELVDLLIATWSITVAGLVIGLVGGFTFVGMLTDGADSAISSRVGKLLGLEKQLRDLADDGMDFKAFQELCEQHKVELSEARLRELFEEADKNQSGTIEANEVDLLMKKVKTEVTPVDAMSNDVLLARMDAMEEKLDKLVRLMEAKAS